MQKTVVNVKKSSIASSKIKREIVVQAMSNMGVVDRPFSELSLKVRTTKGHKSNQMASTPAHSQLHSSIPCQWHQCNTKGREHHAHRDVRYIFRIFGPALEFEVPIVAREQTNKTNEHLSEWRMHVEIEFALQVVGAELAKMRLIPNDNVRFPDFVKPCPTRQERVDGWWDVLRVL